MKYQDILLKDRTAEPEQSSDVSEFFMDLNLDYIVSSITGKRREEYLEKLYLTPLRSFENIRFRQDVFRDLQREEILKATREFSWEMSRVKRYLSGIGRLYRYQAERWLLDSVPIYCDCVTRFCKALRTSRPESEGLASFSRYLEQYVSSDSFQNLRKQAERIITDLDGVRFKMVISPGKIRVSRCQNEPDLGQEIRELFSRFSSPKDQQISRKYTRSGGMSHVEAAVLGMVAKLFPEPFDEMISFFEKNRNYIDEGIEDFHRGIQFYLSYIDFTDKFRNSGLSFCIPFIHENRCETVLRESFDLALAHNLLKTGGKVVTNDLSLNSGESIAVVTGPNHGGKTTFAKSVGQVHYLASLGLPVPGKSASISVPDNIFTHFEREENIDNLRGKLEDDLFRIHQIMEKATSRSLIIINEMLSSTTLKDSLMLGKKILERIREKGTLCFYVTFIDELAEIEGVVSLVGSVSPEDPEVRTFRIERRPADGLAYAMALARKYSLTHDDIIRRVGS
ncbi:MAG: DNA mismatch repair protein MutS [Candidatus Thermoplasmatota archaeon]|nr:DNA mismatch repair protein MutS [Candidatus Thermoplasmatota archaeon]